MRRFSKWAAVCLALVWFSAAARPAQAHPHIWIDSLIQFDMSDGKITSVTLTWRFDAMFSALLIRDFDKDSDKKFSAAETADLKKRAFSALEKLGYFSQARIDGKLKKFGDVAKFSAKIEDGIVVYTFTLKLVEQVDPRRQKATFRFLDTSYYVDVRIHPKTGIHLQGTGTKGCAYKVEKDTDNPIYNGLIVPEMVRVTCPAA